MRMTKPASFPRITTKCRRGRCSTGCSTEVPARGRRRNDWVTPTNPKLNNLNQPPKNTRSRTNSFFFLTTVLVTKQHHKFILFFGFRACPKNMEPTGKFVNFSSCTTKASYALSRKISNILPLLVVPSCTRRVVLSTTSNLSAQENKRNSLNNIYSLNSGRSPTGRVGGVIRSVSYLSHPTCETTGFSFFHNSINSPERINPSRANSRRAFVHASSITQDSQVQIHVLNNA